VSTPLYYRDRLVDRYRQVYDWIPQGTGSVLDIGCGNGVFTQWLRQKADSVTGTDHNRKQLDYGRNEFADVEFVLSEGEELPFESETFDVVVMTEVLEHMSDDRSATAEAARVLKPGGLLIITVPNRGPLAFLDGDNVVNRLVWILSRLRLSRGRHADGTRRTLYEGFEFVKHRHYSLKELQRLLGDGFALEQVSYRGGAVWPMTYLVEKVAEVFLRKPIVETRHGFLRRLRAVDFRCRLGRCSYNLAARFRRAQPSAVRA